MQSTYDLEAVQEKLNNRGLRDVKFFFHNVNSVPTNDMYDQVAYALHTYERGDCTELLPVDRKLEHV